MNIEVEENEHAAFFLGRDLCPQRSARMICRFFIMAGNCNPSPSLEHSVPSSAKAKESAAPNLASSVSKSSVFCRIETRRHEARRGLRGVNLGGIYHAHIPTTKTLRFPIKKRRLIRADLLEKGPCLFAFRDLSHSRRFAFIHGSNSSSPITFNK